MVGFGHWKTFHDCRSAVDKLPTGDLPVRYYTRSGSVLLRYRLPQEATAGDCQIQLEMAGQHLPETVMFTPEHIRISARHWIETCNKPYGGVSGGFLVSNLTPVVDYLTTVDGDMDNPIPERIAFPTISFSTRQAEYLSPGNYDPFIPRLLSVGLEHVAESLGGVKKKRILSRVERLKKQQGIMDPRGQRIPWWKNPYPKLLKTPTLLPPNATAADTAAADEGVLRLPGQSANAGPGGATTAKKARKMKRDGVKEMPVDIGNSNRV
ncbi:MAG: hypothetical protein Q9197_003915 [Variospora fuerteventurae]